jgi:dipeptidyl-peptidase 4
VSFPRQQARTRRFTLGVPRSITFAPDGSRLLFLRTPAGDDPVTGLWMAERSSDGSVEERCLVDPRNLDVEDAELPAEERARRERLREQAGGVVAYATDRAVNLIAFAFGGRLFTHHLPTGQTVQHPSAGPVFDPRPSPDGRRVAYVSGDGLHVVELPGGPEQPGATRPVLIEDGIAWGRAEFVAAEEMRRLRGYWWAPDSLRLAAARVDESEVAVWHIADPANPWKPAVEHRYPAAGTTDADVRLAVVSLEDGRRIDVAWDRADAPYLTRVGWDEDSGEDRLTIQVQSRDQRRVEILRVDTSSGRTTPLRACTDDAWVELIEGSPTWFGDALVTVEDLSDHGPGGSRSLLVDGRPVTPPGMQVRTVVYASDDEVVFTASESDPTTVATYRFVGGEPERLGETTDGVTVATAGGGSVALTTTCLEQPIARVEVQWSPALGGGSGELAVHAEAPEVTVAPRWLTLGERKLRAALLLPTDDDGHRRLPVLLDPYGGPHAQRVLRSTVAMASSQWLADQGFAVLVVDGRGSPGRGPVWEREVHGDLATVPLTDQLDALDAAAEIEPRLDLDRVAIRGWSFGGYLAAVAALRAPDRIRAAIAGAPVTDWRLYDTHYTERYLGVPERTPEAYAVSSLVDEDGGLGPAEPWTEGQTPELMVIHGLADDNVVAAHSLQLSSALLADGRPHRFLPLSGVTHMTPQEVVAEQLLVLQVRFLREALGVDG